MIATPCPPSLRPPLMKHPTPLLAVPLLALTLACCATGPNNCGDDCEAACCAAEAVSEPAADAEDWTSLWDGASDPLEAGWRMAGPGGFRVEDGALVAHGGMGLLWYAEEAYEDFVLSFEWSVSEPSDNSGVFVRFPDPGDDPWVAVHQGYEFQVCDTADPGQETGSAFSFQAATHVPTKPAGEWNHYLVTAVGQRYLVHVNGELVNDFTGERGLVGHVGLQNHDDGSPVRYRDLRVRRLGSGE